MAFGCLWQYGTVVDHSLVGFSNEKLSETIRENYSNLFPSILHSPQKPGFGNTFIHVAGPYQGDLILGGH